MELGAFSISLAVTDLEASRAFYETLGFVVVGGDADQGWQILRNGEAMLGLFAGMFDDNVLTFNPRMGQDMQPRPDGDDVRDIHDAVVEAGIQPEYGAPGMDAPEEPLAGGHGSAGHFMVRDPDGNLVLVDQFELPG
ncbi:VOC family protein [Salsipaludibacter albus]|uniref:VOC family protein n=1 Tax=Salsipaludibacter albus TaxID=2849650 RepID=UPI001EE4617A|nr:VOC family protein [Salsipaludibacter albus]MBY5162271.1 VOC family protein [Salsipaludibacter albus]